MQNSAFSDITKDSEPVLGFLGSGFTEVFIFISDDLVQDEEEGHKTGCNIGRILHGVSSCDNSDQFFILINK